jgi:hypothetical protein
MSALMLAIPLPGWVNDGPVPTSDLVVIARLS